MTPRASAVLSPPAHSRNTRQLFSSRTRASSPQSGIFNPSFHSVHIPSFPWSPALLLLRKKKLFIIRYNCPNLAGERRSCASCWNLHFPLSTLSFSGWSCSGLARECHNQLQKNSSCSKNPDFTLPAWGSRQVLLMPEPQGSILLGTALPKAGLT